MNRHPLFIVFTSILIYFLSTLLLNNRYLPLFLTVSFILIHFTPNPIITSIILVVVGILFFGGWYLREGLENMPEQQDERQETIEETKIKKNIKVQPVSTQETPDNSINFGKTVQNSYAELQEQLGPDGLAELNYDTQNLLKQQTKLTESMQNLQSMFQSIKKLLPQNN